MMQAFFWVMFIAGYPFGLVLRAGGAIYAWKTRCMWCNARGGKLCTRCEAYARGQIAFKQPVPEA